MSIPAIRALKQTFESKITVLASPSAAVAAQYFAEVDEVIPFNSPWNREAVSPAATKDMIDLLRSRRFDAAIILTVYSQNPLPAALLAFMAEIPKRLAYCRENPYQLLTDWVPDKEPYFLIEHQVQRDIKLVESIGATVGNDHLSVRFSAKAKESLRQKLISSGIDINKPWIVLHAGVSEDKREYPHDKWVSCGKEIVRQLGYQILLTGNSEQKERIDQIAIDISGNTYSIAGLLSFEEFVALIDQAPLVVTVNTVTVHIASATQTPVVVLYALTNPQHTPWKVPSEVLHFHPPKDRMSSNQVVQYVYQHQLIDIPDDATPERVVQAIQKLLVRN